MSQQNNVISVSLHPESLMDELYVEHELGLDAYRGPTGPWNIHGADTQTQTCAELQSADGGGIRVEVLGEDILRVRVQPGAAAGKNEQADGWKPTVTEDLQLIDPDQFTRTELSIQRTEREITVQGAGMEFRQQRNSGEFSVAWDEKTILETVDGGVRFSPEPPDFSGVRSFAAFKLAPDEAIWGFGGRVRPVNRRGQTLDVFAEKVGKKFGDYGGFPLPFFISSRGYGVFFNNPWPHVYFDMGSTWPDRWFVTAPGGDVDFFIIRGPDVADIVRRFTALTGRIAPPQKFLFGFWVSSLSFETAEELKNVATRLQQEEYPCDNLVLDGPWRGGPDFIARYQELHEYINNDLQWHPDFGDGPAMLRSLQEQGFKLTLHLNSRIFTRETAAAGLAQGVLRQHGDEIVVKLEDEAGEKFFLDHLQPRIEEGVDLWWTDHTDRVSGEIKPGIPSRNLFGPLWNRLLAQAMAAAGKDERLSLSRGGGIGSQRYALPWPGDTAAGIDRFAEDIWFCLNAGLSGFPITSVDMGGFASRSGLSKEESYEVAFGKDNLHRRIFQSIMFIPAPRIHNSYMEIPRLPWNCPLESRDLYRDFLRERYRLTPYFYSLGIEASYTGEPVLRPLFYHFQSDRATYDVSDVLLIGKAILVAPVIAAAAETRRFYLPAGTWYDYWSGQKIDGGREVELPCPVDRLEGLPMLVRAGTILPLQAPGLFLSPEPPSTLILKVFPDENGQATGQYYEGPQLLHTFCLQQKPDDAAVFCFSAQNNTAARREYEIVCGDRASHLSIAETDETQQNSVSPSGSIRFSMDPHTEKQVLLRKTDAPS